MFDIYSLGPETETFEMNGFAGTLDPNNGEKRKYNSMTATIAVIVLPKALSAPFPYANVINPERKRGKIVYAVLHVMFSVF